MEETNHLLSVALNLKSNGDAEKYYSACSVKTKYVKYQHILIPNSHMMAF